MRLDTGIGGKLMRILTIISIALFYAATVFGVDFNLAWDYPQPDGYRLYCAPLGEALPTIPTVETVELTSPVTVPDGEVWRCAVRAFVGDDESGDSNYIVLDTRSDGPQTVYTPTLQE